MKLKDYLIKKKITKIELANELGVSRQCVEKWVAGKSTPSPINVLAIKKFTKNWVKYEDLVNL